MRDSASASKSSRRVLFPSVRGVFYGWWLVGIAAFMLTLMSLTVFQGLGTMMVALERKFGWSRTALSGAFALSRAEGAVLGPIEGFLIDRLGSRRMTLIGYLIMAVGFVLQSRVNELWQFYAAFIVISLGAGLGGWLAMIAMVNNWFNRKRSIAMASAMSGAQFGGFLVPLFAFCIESFGFRWVSLGIGVLMFVIIGPVTKAIRNHPEEYGMRPDGDPPEGEADGSDREAQAAAANEPQFTVRQALRTPAFWLLTIAQVTSSVAIVSLSLHLSPKLTDMGMSLTHAGVVTLAYTMTALPAMILSGLVADRLPKPPLIAFSAVPAVGGDSAAGAERDRDDVPALGVRVLLRHRFRGKNAADDGDTGRVLRAAGVRDDHGSVAASDERRDDLRAAVRGVYVRHHGHLYSAVHGVRGAELSGRGVDVVRAAAGGAGAGGCAGVRGLSPLQSYGHAACAC